MTFNLTAQNAIPIPGVAWVGSMALAILVFVRRKRKDGGAFFHSHKINASSLVA